MTKKILSVAAIAALMGTGAQAFNMKSETRQNGSIRSGVIVADTGKPANYSQGMPAAVRLHKSTDAVFNNIVIADSQKGDALIFPAFNTKDAWGSEFSVRNNLLRHAVIAKVVLYAADDSREILDFNVYLSAKDQVRFKIENGVLTSTDGSILVKSDNQGLHFASEANPFTVPVVDRVTGEAVKVGYTAVLGMVQSPDMLPVVNYDPRFHDDHAGIYNWYLGLLNIYRPNWTTAEMTNGTYTDFNRPVVAPNMGQRGNMREVQFDALSGVERMYNATGDERDLKIDAVALANFTDFEMSPNQGQVMLYAPAEQGDLQDRNIRTFGGQLARYDTSRIIGDVATFLVGKATYTYDTAANEVENKLLVLQPMKRAVVQAGELRTWASNWWTTCPVSPGVNPALPLTGMEYGFRAGLDIYNEDETHYLDHPITSPGNTQDPYCTELVEMTYLEQVAVEDDPADFANKNGFVDVSFLSGASGRLPAIVSQMSASRVGTSGQINWLYTPANKILDQFFTVTGD